MTMNSTAFTSLSCLSVLKSDLVLMQRLVSDGSLDFVAGVRANGAEGAFPAEILVELDLQVDA